MGCDGGVGDSPVATGDSGMPDSAAMILTGGQTAGRGRCQDEARWKDGV
jgi:hypothetical protein